MTSEAIVRKTETVPIRISNDVVRVRQAARALAVELGVNLVDQTKIVTAASELGRNTLEHGLGGVAELAIIEIGSRKGVRMSFRDDGPGISDIELAMRDGYSSGSGLGLGLSGSKRLMSEFEITSTPGHGTTVTVIRWRP